MEKIQNIKLIAMDLDDTLLRDDLTISDYTVAVLKAVMEKGILPVLASGRSPRSVHSYTQRIGSDKIHSYMLCNNGAQILTSDMQQELLTACLDTPLALEMYDYIESQNLSCHLYFDDTIYVVKRTKYSDRDSHLTKMKVIIPDDYREVLRTKTVYKLLIPADPEVITAVEPEFRKRFGTRAVLFTSKPYFLEIIPLHSGKGEFLEKLADMLGIGMQSVMAFGDSMNDETMIQLAGYGIAMKNGLQVIQDSAYAVTDFTNNEDGIARFLEQHLL